MREFRFNQPCYKHDKCGDECFGMVCPHYREPPRLYQRCRFAGNLWTVVYVNNGHVNLTSLDGRQFKHNISVSEIQLIDEFKDCYPEE